MVCWCVRWCDGVMVRDRRNVSMETKPIPEFHRIPRVCVVLTGTGSFYSIPSSSSSLYFPAFQNKKRERGTDRIFSTAVEATIAQGTPTEQTK